MKTLFLAPLAALLFAVPARAAPLQTLRLLEQPQDKGHELADILEVSGHPTTGTIILHDALYGGLIGLVVGGGVALATQDGNLGRDLGVGAGVGLLVGVVYGALTAASFADQAPGPVRF